jgi:o-succinylbenzoate---CoA ligase
MTGYPHNAITINNREVTLPEILSGHARKLSPFESETFSFIQKWLRGENLFILNTSGSTGTPKEIKITRLQLQQSAKRTITALELSDQDTVFVCLDTKYIAGKMMLVRALEGNMKIVAVDPSSNPLSKCNRLNIDFAAFVPLQLSEMVKYEDCIHQLNKMKAIIVGGAAIPPSLLKEIKKLTCRAYATYGMTETVSHIALQLLNSTSTQDHFLVLPGIKIEKDDRECLTIQIPEFPEKIITNDIVELIKTDQFKWLGRFDNVINSGGFKIFPEKVEREIEKELPGNAFFITGIPHEQLGEKLILVVEGSPSEINLSKLTLHPYEVPKDIIWVSQFIRTETGKINRTKTKSLIANS